MLAVEIASVSMVKENVGVAMVVVLFPSRENGTTERASGSQYVAMNTRARGMTIPTSMQELQDVA